MASFSSTDAEIAHVQLRSCLVNLPPALAEAVVNAGTPAQNLIVELQVQSPGSTRQGASDPSKHSVFVGWTGVSSRRRPNAPYPSSSTSSKAGAVANFVEIDSAFARVLDLAEGQKVSVVLRQDPELVHTLNVEPLTPGDWEMIELHAAFLETNLQAQVRALPNPNYAGSKTSKPFPHPLTLHLSPTSTANIVVSSFTPAVPSTVAFAKLASDAEVIVAPKSRTRSPKTGRTENRSVAGLSQRSAEGRSGTGSTRSRSHKVDPNRQTLFLRAVSNLLLPQSKSQLQETNDFDTPAIWIEDSVVKEKLWKICEWVTVSAVSTSGANTGASPEELQKLQAQEASESGRPATKIVARLNRARYIPNANHAVLSVTLAAAIGLKKTAGEVVRIEPAPPVTSRNQVKAIKIYPFQTESSSVSKSLRIGGDGRGDNEVLAHDLRQLFGSKEGNGLLGGPLTDGMMLPEEKGVFRTWKGGLIRFEPRATTTDGKPSATRWTVDHKEDLTVDIGEEILNPLGVMQEFKIGPTPFPSATESLIGFQKISDQVVASLVHQSSVLLEGGMGAGKTSLAALVAQRLVSEMFFHMSYLDCRKFGTEESRVSTIKEELKRVFMEAWWGSQLGGKSVVIFDGLDKLCPAETELQVGNDNAKSRQLSEIFSSIVHQYCSGSSGIVVLATAIDKESLQSSLVGSHVVRDIISIKAPDKSQRRDILEALAFAKADPSPNAKAQAGRQRHTSEPNGIGNHDATSDEEDIEQVEAFQIDEDIDFLDIAGKTDGYMPGDLVLVVSRTRSEAVMRSIRDDDADHGITISSDDFTRALKGFTPVSLRNVALQSSSTTFDSIGGLEKTRKILLETLQYPTTYAPIFAKCPLRLRSGLLLYGYPGCGKTLLASAVAGECGLNFISVKGPEILNKYIGASEKSVRDLFDRAESAKPCVLFFDEFDSIAPKRGHDSTGVTDRVVNQLLTQMDGAEALSGVYVLAATSRPDLIDPALLRPGRLDKSLLCDMPDENDRLGILQALSKSLKMTATLQKVGSSPQKNLAEVARRTEGYSGADLQAVVYNAHLEAVHEVLGDHKVEAQPKKLVAAKPRSVKRQELLAFRFGEHRNESNGTDLASSPPYKLSQLGERATLLAQLEALKLAKRKEKALRRGQHDLDGSQALQKAESTEPIITWKHIEASLASTRRSINEVERNKLQRIYREFLVGRTGEMPNGQASTEVGARSSLM